MKYESIAFVLTRDVLSGEPTWMGIGCDVFTSKRAATEHAHAVGRAEVESGAAERYRVEVTEIRDTPRRRVTDAHRAANKRYDKTNTKQVMLKLNTNTDADIIAWLDQQSNKQGAIKELVRAAIESQA